MANTIKQDVIHEIKETFNELKYKYEYFDERSRFVIAFDLDSLIDLTRISIFVEDSFYIAFAAVNVNINKNLPQAYEYIARANCGLLNGNFEINSETGRLRYKVFVHFGDKIPSRETISHTISTAVKTVERYIDGLLDVITGASTPKDAIEKAENLITDSDEEE